MIVSTVRAAKYNAGVARDDLQQENVAAVERGAVNVRAHVENVRKFGVPVIVALNRFIHDTDAEVAALKAACDAAGATAVECDPWGGGGEGCLDLADAVHAALESGDADFRPLYPSDMGLAEKVETISREIYGADGVDFDATARKSIERLEAAGMRDAPVCIAKTQYSLSDDPTKLGRPSGFRISVRDVAPSAGAGFAVVLTGNVMTMPGLGVTPAAMQMGVEDGKAVGLF